MTTNITFKGNAIFLFFKGSTSSFPGLALLVRVDLWICFLPMKHHASSFVPNKSNALGIGAIEKTKVILERMVEYKYYLQI